MQALTEFNADQLRDLEARRELVWLDLVNPSDADLDTIGAIIGLHPLAVEDSRDFSQRPKLDPYPGRSLMVFYGLNIGEDQVPRQVEVHIHMTEYCVLTLSRHPPVALERVRRSLQENPQCDRRELTYRILDAIADSLVDGLDQVARQLNAFEKTIYTRPRASERDHMAKMGRKLSQLRRTLGAQRQMFEHAVDHIKAIPGNETIGPYLGDIGDHLWQALDETEADRETINSMLQTYSNSVQERLTVVATVFLPLTALTGFFGMNFNWLISHIGSAWTFFGIGVGGMVASCVLISVWLRRSGLTDRRGRTT